MAECLKFLQEMEGAIEEHRRRNLPSRDSELIAFEAEATCDSLSAPPTITSFTRTTQPLKGRRSTARWYVCSAIVQDSGLILFAVSTEFGGDPDAA
jgi:hypothetical protein